MKIQDSKFKIQDIFNAEDAEGAEVCRFLDAEEDSSAEMRGLKGASLRAVTESKASADPSLRSG